jgi:hypothetical protein
MTTLQFGVYEVIKKYYINERRENMKKERAMKLLNTVQSSAILQRSSAPAPVVV